VHRVLTIDDDEWVARALGANLRAGHYEHRAAATGREGLTLASRHSFDAVLLGPDLPDMSGLEVLSGLRGWTSVPIIVISQPKSELDRIHLLDAGADACVTKPFGMGELLARLRALLRRSQRSAEAAIVATDDFTIDLAAKRVTNGTSEIHLTSTEWRLVQVLLRNAGKVVTQQALLQEVWGPDYVTETQYLRIYLKQIRAKLEPVPGRPRYFLTYRGLGVRFSDDDTEAERRVMNDALPAKA